MCNNYCYETKKEEGSFARGRQEKVGLSIRSPWRTLFWEVHSSRYYSMCMYARFLLPGNDRNNLKSRVWSVIYLDNNILLNHFYKYTNAREKFLMGEERKYLGRTRSLLKSRRGAWIKAITCYVTQIGANISKHYDTMYVHSSGDT